MIRVVIEGLYSGLERMMLQSLFPRGYIPMIYSGGTTRGSRATEQKIIFGIPESNSIPKFLVI